VLLSGSWSYTHYYMHKYYIHGGIILTRCTHYLTSIFVLLLWKINKHVVVVPHRVLWSYSNTYSFTTIYQLPHVYYLFSLYLKTKRHIIFLISYGYTLTQNNFLKTYDWVSFFFCKHFKLQEKWIAVRVYDIENCWVLLLLLSHINSKRLTWIKITVGSVFDIF